MSSHPLYRQHHTHSLYDITFTICVASFALYKTSHPHFMISNHRIYVITNTIFDIASTVSVSSHPNYWWYYTNSISEITSAIIHDIISIVYDMKATVWHHNDCIRDIDSLHMTSPPAIMTSCPLYLCHHRHSVCEYTSTIFNIKHMVLRQYNHYIWNHSLHMCICVITHTVLMI